MTSEAPPGPVGPLVGPAEWPAGAPIAYDRGAGARVMMGEARRR